MTGLVHGCFHMWNTGDTSRIEELLTPDWVDHAHPDVTGPAAVRDAVHRIRAERPDLHLRIDEVPVGTDRAAAVGAGGLLWLFEIRAGRLAALWTYRR